MLNEFEVYNIGFDDRKIEFVDSNNELVNGFDNLGSVFARIKCDALDLAEFAPKLLTVTYNSNTRDISSINVADTNIDNGYLKSQELGFDDNYSSRYLQSFVLKSLTSIVPMVKNVKIEPKAPEEAVITGNMTLSSPVPRGIYQRDAQNAADVPISASSSETFDKAYVEVEVMGSAPGAPVAKTELL